MWLGRYCRLQIGQRILELVYARLELMEAFKDMLRGWRWRSKLDRNLSTGKQETKTMPWSKAFNVERQS
jgi:hypothetical protein